MGKYSCAFLALFMTSGMLSAAEGADVQTEDQKFLAENTPKEGVTKTEEAQEFSPDNPYVVRNGPHTGAHVKVPAGAEGFLQSGVYSEETPFSGMQKTAINAAQLGGEAVLGSVLMKFWHSDIGKKLTKARADADVARAKVENSFMANGMSDKSRATFRANSDQIAALETSIGEVEAAIAGDTEALATETVALAQMRGARADALQRISLMADLDGPVGRKAALANLEAEFSAQEQRVAALSAADKLKSLNNLRSELAAVEKAQATLTRSANLYISGTSEGLAIQEKLVANEAAANKAVQSLAAKAARSLPKKVFIWGLKAAGDVYIVTDIGTKAAVWVATGDLIKPLAPIDLGREFVRRSQDN